MGGPFIVTIILAVVVILRLAFSEQWRTSWLQRLGIRGRRASSANTPPRSFSPEKSGVADSPYIDTFPPFRREALLKIQHPQSAQRSRHSTDVTEESVRKVLLPHTTNYKECTDLKYTPTGFSLEDIRELGDFPDYATLSDVPLPTAYSAFDINKARPRPYRPFRWNYHQTMSLTKLETDWWLELDSDYSTRIAQRQKIYAEHGKAILDCLPGSELACKELMEMAIQFLCARYPHYFSLSPDKRYFRNGILGTENDLHVKSPLMVLLDNIPEDFAVMLRDEETGYYFFRAGIICSSLGWNLGSKLGLQLHQIHSPIPDYKEKMQFSMDRYFSKMPTDKPIQRASWGLEVETPLYMPPGDPHEKHRLTQNPSLTISDCHLRVDWQTLRRLPLSGAIVFNFKALFTPVTEFRDEPSIPALVAKILKEGKRSMMEYKNTWHVEHVVVPTLEEWAKEQIEKGLVEPGWEVSTLEESPWFKGWEEKWHRQQGF